MESVLLYSVLALGISVSINLLLKDLSLGQLSRVKKEISHLLVEEVKTCAL